MPLVLISGNLNLLEPSGPVKACNGTALRLPYLANSLATAVSDPVLYRLLPNSKSFYNAQVKPMDLSTPEAIVTV
jgi:hypothetical protein